MAVTQGLQDENYPHIITTQMTISAVRAGLVEAYKGSHPIYLGLYKHDWGTYINYRETFRIPDNYELEVIDLTGY